MLRTNLLLFASMIFYKTNSYNYFIAYNISIIVIIIIIIVDLNKVMVKTS
jgi:hypothetical protein